MAIPGMQGFCQVNPGVGYGEAAPMLRAASPASVELPAAPPDEATPPTRPAVEGDVVRVTGGGRAPQPVSTVSFDRAAGVDRGDRAHFLSYDSNILHAVLRAKGIDIGDGSPRVVRQAVMQLQTELGFPHPDGRLGPQTVQRLIDQSPELLDQLFAQATTPEALVQAVDAADFIARSQGMSAEVLDGRIQAAVDGMDRAGLMRFAAAVEGADDATAASASLGVRVVVSDAVLSRAAELVSTAVPAMDIPELKAFVAAVRPMHDGPGLPPALGAAVEGRLTELAGQAVHLARVHGVPTSPSAPIRITALAAREMFGGSMAGITDSTPIAQILDTPGMPPALRSAITDADTAIRTRRPVTAMPADQRAALTILNNPASTPYARAVVVARLSGMAAGGNLSSELLLTARRAAVELASTPEGLGHLATACGHVGVDIGDLPLMPSERRTIHASIQTHAAQVKADLAGPAHADARRWIDTQVAQGSGLLAAMHEAAPAPAAAP